jgi:hypothetical protein
MQLISKILLYINVKFAYIPHNKFFHIFSVILSHIQPIISFIKNSSSFHIHSQVVYIEENIVLFIEADNPFHNLDILGDTVGYKVLQSVGYYKLVGFDY